MPMIRSDGGRAIIVSLPSIVAQTRGLLQILLAIHDADASERKMRDAFEYFEKKSEVEASLKSEWWHQNKNDSSRLDFSW